MKKVYLVHGWSGNPQNCWFPWLKQQLENQGFQVESLAMPNPDEPDPFTWSSELAKQVPNPDMDTYLVGHSIGCQTIMRYLERLPAEEKIGGVLFVAPFFKLVHLSTQEEKDIWSKWEAASIDINKVASHPISIVSIFSDDDPDVNYDSNMPSFKAMGARIIQEHHKGHFSDDDGVTELPIALEELLKMAN